MIKLVPLEAATPLVKPSPLGEVTTAALANYPVIWTTDEEAIRRLVRERGFTELPSPGLIYVSVKGEPEPPPSSVPVVRLVHTRNGRRYYSTKRSFIEAMVKTGHWVPEGIVGFVDLVGSVDQRTKEISQSHGPGGTTIASTKETLLVGESQRLMWADQFRNAKVDKFNAPEIPYMKPQRDCLFRLSESQPDNYTRWRKVGFVPTELRSGVRRLFGATAPFPSDKRFDEGITANDLVFPPINDGNTPGERAVSVPWLFIAVTHFPLVLLGRGIGGLFSHDSDTWVEWEEKDKVVEGPDDESEWADLRMKVYPVSPP